MKLIVGLGNPGEKLGRTRHNIGFMFLDYLARSRDSDNNIRLLKPQHFMNNSGTDVSHELHYYKIPVSSLIVIHDDLDIRLGEYKIQKGKGPKVHNGISDIEAKLKSKDFWRVRIGVDNRPAKNRIPGEAYVLEDFPEDELSTVESLFPTIESEVGRLLK